MLQKQLDATLKEQKASSVSQGGLICSTRNKFREKTAC